MNSFPVTIRCRPLHYWWAWNETIEWRGLTETFVVHYWTFWIPFLDIPGLVANTDLRGFFLLQTHREAETSFAKNIQSGKLFSHPRLVKQILYSFKVPTWTSTLQLSVMTLFTSTYLWITRTLQPLLFGKGWKLRST